MAQRLDCPAALVDFDRVMSERSSTPFDRCEYSVAVAGGFAPWRTVYYFDVARHSGAQARWADSRFVSAADRLGISLDHPFGQRLRAGGFGSTGLLQVAVGIDVRPDEAETRLKYYFIFEGDPGRSVLAPILETLGARLPDGVETHTVHMIGVDLTRSGVHDAKLYVGLDPDRVHRVLRHAKPFFPFFDRVKAAVLHTCLLRPSKTRKIHFAVDNSDAIRSMLDGMLLDVPGTARLKQQVAAINEAFPPGLEPWVLAFEYEEGAFDTTRYAVYFEESQPEPTP